MTGSRDAPDFATPCFRRMKQIRGGAWVGARIHRTCHCTICGGDENEPHRWRDVCDRYPQLAAEINGKPSSVERVWTSGEDITEDYYRFLIDHRDWSARYRPDSAEANPRKPVDFNTLAPPTF